MHRVSSTASASYLSEISVGIKLWWRPRRMLTRSRLSPGRSRLMSQVADFVPIGEDVEGVRALVRWWVG